VPVRSIGDSAKTDTIAAIVTVFLSPEHVLEQRRFPRYQLAIPLTGLVEQEGERYAGSVLNISAGGFYLHLAKAAPEHLVIHGASDFGEIHYAGRNANGFGSLIRVERFVKGVGVGFGWDNDGMDADSLGLISELIGAQEARRALGRVTIAETEVVLGGLVSSALANDIFIGLRKGSAGSARLSLHDCTSIDSSGVEMLMALRDRGVTIVNVGPEIERIIQRFQLSTADPENDK
jgi:PilZ domain